MRQADELPVKERILAKATDGDAKASLEIHIQGYLRTVVLCQVLNELLRRRGKRKFLGQAPERFHRFNQLLFGRLLSEIDKDSRRMSVQNRNTDALGGNLHVL